MPLLWSELIGLCDKQTLLCDLEDVRRIRCGTEGEVHLWIDALTLGKATKKKKKEAIGHVAKPQNHPFVCVFGTYVFKVLILHVQHQGFVAVGVDKRGRRLLRLDKSLVLGHLESWVEVVDRHNSHLDRGNRVLPGVVVLVSLAKHQEQRNR